MTDPTLFDNQEHTTKHYVIKNDSTFNGTALTPEELLILRNKFQMHGHFKLVDDFTSENPASSLSNNYSNINKTEFSSDENINKSDQFQLINNLMESTVDQSNQFFYNKNIKLMPNNNINNNNYLFFTETRINNSMPTSSEINNLKPATYCHTVDNNLQQFVDNNYFNMYQDIPLQQCNDQYLNNSHYSLDKIYKSTIVSNTSNLESSSEQFENITDKDLSNLIDISDNILQLTIQCPQCNQYFVYNNDK